MKKIEAIISPGKLEDVREVLSSAGIPGITVTEVRDFNKQKEHKEIYRGSEYNVSYLNKIQVGSDSSAASSAQGNFDYCKNWAIREKGTR
ncbi:MAG: P-II family nitrogen regulator [Bacteroidota bacterium]|jgi:nitrogen regulatory protein PII